MSSYFQLRNHDPDTPDADETVKHPLLHGEGFSADQDGIVSPPNGRSWSDWLTLGLSVLMMATSVALYVDSTKIVAPRSADGLRKPDAYPNLDEVAAFREKRKGPLMWFPGPILRANRAQPDEVFGKSSHVVLSPTDSMFYQFRIKENNFQWCYIDAVVPTAEAAAKGGKSFVGSGDVYNIQVWNVSAPQKLESMSWNTRPERVELMGIVAWLDERARMKVLDWEDGWQMKPQAPRFPCNGHKWMTFEVTCDNCTLEFDQIFSDPPMAFDLLQLA